MSNRILLAGVACAAILICGGAVASTGHTLMDGVRANQKIEKGEVPDYAEAVAWGYLTGIVRASSGILQKTGGVCPAAGLGKEELLAVTSQWLDTHRNQLDDPDFVLVARALAERFPCRQPKTQ